MEIRIDDKCLLNVPEERDYELSDSYLEDAYIIHTGKKEKDEHLSILKEYLDYYLERGVRQSYRELSPKIVEQINDEPCKELFYEYIYARWVVPLMKCIQQHNELGANTIVDTSKKALDTFYVTKKHEKVDKKAHGLSNIKY